MSTLVLARKYRPRNFAQMVGQGHVVTSLTHALTQGRLHHAYLFTGTRGIGKTTVSRILAKSLNCTGADGQGGITAEPCGVCPACTAIDADRYLDYTELDAASNRGIDEARELIERASYKPSLGRFKVFMIDEAHQLTKDAFNALLKTLEEPPEYLKFVLATTDPDKMLPTVLSRCLQFNLRPMAPDTVQAHLREVLNAEAVAFDESALRLLGRAARGSMRDALSLADQAIAYGGGAVREDTVRGMLGAVDRSHVGAIVRALAGRDGAALLDQIQALRTHGLSASGVLEELCRLLQHMAVAQAVPGALEAADEEQAQALALAPLLAADETQLLYAIALKGRPELSLMGDEYGALTMVLLRFLAFPAQGLAESAPGTGSLAAPLAREPVQRSTTPSAVAAPAGPALMTEAPSARAAELPAAGEPAAVAPAPARPPATAALRAAPNAAVAATPLPQAASGAGRLPAPRPARAAISSAPVARVLQEPPPWVSEPTPAFEEDDAGAIALAMAPSRRANAASPDAAATVPSAPPAAVPLQPTALGERWAGLVRQLRERELVAALVRELAMQAELCAEADGCFTLRVERDSLRNEAFADKLAAALCSVVGGAVRIVLQAGAVQDSPARREAAERAALQARAEAAIAADPLVRSLLEEFKGARIVPGSIKPLEGQHP